ncbi:hypothetical protein KGQ20_14350 [Catenulispora sp. NF23]|uniref:Carrier domain-containing protein n=1 Tax=Catenulispora pinistramenti TaxID=2705254 RepID=A0ABS5KWY5_9ACTN|nr:phosphopantetheine-binding protein [Catenulispora pinistramenti]MBS2533952.1 hypothetical protein [Catenulispora pinistramenti]MBS2550573.1 hypothetical protein [Catenulispora pinistramenti]
MSEGYRMAADAFHTLLKTEIDESTDFFAAGGNSLQAAQMLRGLRGSGGSRPRLGEFLLDPTPAGLARQLVGED